MNTPNQYQSAVIIDEFTVLSIPNFVNIPETARSNKIATCIAIQDISQLIARYGKEEASSIISNMGNQFLFRTTNPETLDHFQKTLGKRELIYQSISKSPGILNSTRSVNESLLEKDILRRENVIKFKPGEVFGIIAEGNKHFIEGTRINGNHYIKKRKNITSLKSHLDNNDQNIYNQVYEDVKNIITRATSAPRARKFDLK